MKKLIEYRTSLIDRLVAAAGEFRAECLAAREPFTPLEPGGWNTHQMAVHTRDVGRLVYGARVRTTAEDLDPEFENFDGETYMTEYYSAGEPLEDILNSLVEEAGSLAGLLRALPAQAWARTSSHVMLARALTLRFWVEKGLAHIEELVYRKFLICARTSLLRLLTDALPL